MILGWIVVIIGSILFLVAAFSENILWGIACLISGFAGLFFLIFHWEEAKTPFLIQLAGFGIIFIGMIMGG